MVLQQKESFLFALKDVSVKPTTPRLKEPITISGKIDLFRIPFVGPLWVLATITYPEKWWEKIIPIIGAPRIRETTIALGGNFSINLPVGFDRDGDYSLKLGVYPGPTAALDSVVIPPAPAIASFDGKFTVSSEIAPGEVVGGQPSGLAITAYDSVSPPSVAKVKPGTTLRVVSEFDYTGPATTGKFYTALWHPSWYDPHDEIVHGEKPFTLPDSPQGSHVKGYVDITVPSGFIGTDFGLYTKLTGGIKDVVSPYYANIVEILAPVGAPPEETLETLEVVIDPVGAGYVTTSPAPSGGVQHNWLFPYGTTVYVTAHPNPGYTLASWVWSGEMTDSQAATAPVYPMTEHRRITAHFKTEEAPPPPPTGPIVTDFTIVNPNKSTWIGGIITITVMFFYKGPATTAQLYAAIGVKDTWFNEKWDSGWIAVPLSGATAEYVKLANAYMNIEGGSPGTYDIYAKISVPGLADVFTPVYLDTIIITL